jgi:hypothetical protein
METTGLIAGLRNQTLLKFLIKNIKKIDKL